MRILPLYNEIKNRGVVEEFNQIRNVSALTHGHIRSAISCLLYLIFIDEIDKNQEKNKAYENTQIRMRNFFEKSTISEDEQQYFHRLVNHDIRDLEKNEIKSGFYVIESFEACIWCFLTTESYKQSVLKAVNLGRDTDTTAAITGSLAGFYYGQDKIPMEWKNDLVDYDFIKSLCQGKKITTDDPIFLGFPEEISEIQIKRKSFLSKIKSWFTKSMFYLVFITIIRNMNMILKEYLKTNFPKDLEKLKFKNPNNAIRENLKVFKIDSTTIYFGGKNWKNINEDIKHIEKKNYDFFFLCLFGIVTIDLAIFHYYNDSYEQFRRLTNYPKFGWTGFGTHYESPKKIILIPEKHKLINTENIVKHLDEFIDLFISDCDSFFSTNKFEISTSDFIEKIINDKGFKVSERDVNTLFEIVYNKLKSIKETKK